MNLSGSDCDLWNDWTGGARTSIKRTGLALPPGMKSISIKICDPELNLVNKSSSVTDSFIKQ